MKAFSLNIKLINPDKKSVFETYVLREVGSFNAATPIQLRQQILKQFGDKLASSKLDFPVGYFRSGCKLWIRSDDDIKDVWSFIEKGESISIWCHGISSLALNSSEDDESPTRKPKRKKRKKMTHMDEKNERIDELNCSSAA